MTYYDELSRAMTLLARGYSATFLGQSIVAGGTGMTGTFRDVPEAQKIETPVAEAFEMGLATGLALDGALPVICFPRINFMLLALGQLVLHLDALPRFSGYRPRVIIRTAIATRHPLDPGPQHLGNYSDAIEDMLVMTNIRRLLHAEDIVNEYEKAARSDRSTILIEHVSLYNTVPRERAVAETFLNKRRADA